MTDATPFECAMCGSAYADRGARIQCCEKRMADEDRFNTAQLRNSEPAPTSHAQKTNEWLASLERGDGQ